MHPRAAIREKLSRAATAKLGLRSDLSNLSHPLSLIERLGMTCRGLIHVGANTAPEFDDYRRAGLACVVYIEPIPHIFAALKERVSIDPRHHAIQALCTDRTGDEIDFNVASNGGESSSIFSLGNHATKYPEITYQTKVRMQSRTLDDIIFSDDSIQADAIDCLVMDVQGAEMKVIAGALRTLAQCRYVFTEVNEGGLYQGDSSYTDVVSALKRHGFALRSLDLNEKGWGNAFLVRRGLL